MNNKSDFFSLIKLPSAWLPIAMSILALTMILGYVALFGIVQQEDEGTPAHIFQLLMVLQLPIIAYFGLKWLPKRPIQSLLILALQIIAWIVPILTVLWFESL